MLSLFPLKIERFDEWKLIRYATAAEKAWRRP